ncbi:fanconi-associated nuclease 1 homolog isoform X2 [Alnus glutinosa]|uniref:fanconi-associated nuclease 1 homolog isoform X2 n=1 Tax=Alnus glutinosa TaxID=3517 RepID=UPI002D7908CE|nr:fanconi-associated nuclease 1 homolog isoform X2 [Alnus glutinosa]
MLRGRESLIRLVGKRRRFLPNRETLLSAPVGIGDDGKIVSVENAEADKKLDECEEEREFGNETCHPEELVTCPVCGHEVIGEHNAINSHLDACLSRGTKRKLTQQTLLQSNFWSQSKIQASSLELEQLENSVCDTGPDDRCVRNAVHGLLEFSATKENDIDLCGSSLKLESVVQTYKDGPSENPINDDKINYSLDTTQLLSPKNEVLKGDRDVTIDDISGATLETFIVGRRFSDEKELHLGASISLLRDPDNDKDPNAIKVISADTGCGKMLGFLPRELAQYLSPLIEKFCLSFEIVCHKSILRGEKEYEVVEAFKCLWKNAKSVVESSKDCPPSMTKYQQNFCLLIHEVLRSNPHLFTDDEKNFMESFTSLSNDSQRLFVRLYLRKGPWFRMSHISYSEVLDPQEAVKGLSATGYICSVEDTDGLHDNDIKEMLNLLTVSELRDILGKLKNCNHGTRKKNLIESLLSSYEDGLCPSLPSGILDKTGACIRISSKAESLIWRAEKLFFLNSEQDLSAFLLVDLGIVKYPTYNCIISEQIFSGRDDLLAYEEAIEVAQLMDQALDGNDVELVLKCIKIADFRISLSPTKAIKSSTSESVATFLSRFSALWVYSKVVSLGVSFLERERRYKDAINLLKWLLTCFTCDGRRGYWTLRLSINLEHIGCPNESLAVAEDGLQDPWVRAGSRMALQRRILRLGKPPRRWKTPSFSASIKRKITEVHVQGRPLNCEMGMKNRFYGEDGEQCGVEQLALQYYAGEGGGWQGVHTESGIWLTIFGLLMWDIIFSDVPNVFRTKFQTAPLDLENDSFYPARKSCIESHLQNIHSGMAEGILIMSWESHVGTACRGVNWTRHSLTELRAAVTCVGGPCLASLCRHLAQDYRSWSSGMPDLLLWRFHGEYRGEAKLVEVKGPRDQLSEQQRAWLLFLMDCGFNTEVCKVSPLPMSA